MKKQASVGKSAFKVQTFIRGKYYIIKNLSSNLFLSVDKNVSSENVIFQKHNSFNLQQIWMVEEVAQLTFQIVHPLSAMVLEITQNFVKLKPNKLKNSQTFYVDKTSSDLQSLFSNVYVFKEFKQSKRCLFSEFQELRCEERAHYKDECNKWVIQPVIDNPLINETCLIENCNFGLIVSINQSKEKKETYGQIIVQSLMANLFGQRWLFLKKNEFFAIKSLKTGLVLDINRQDMKEGNQIIQWGLKDSLNQLWILEQHGKRIYLIRSAMDPKFMLGVKGKSMKDESELIITKHEEDAFWRIVGPINF